MNMKQERFKSLTSNGPVFPETYNPIGFKLANEILSPLAEEMLWKAARFLESDYEKEAFFSSNHNMWACLKPELSAKQKLLSFPNDFLPLLKEMKEKQEENKANKKLISKEQKLKEKEAKEQLKEQYGYAILNGERVPLTGFMIEAPNWILTRGKDPRKFLWKYAVEPSDVFLNIVNEKAPSTACQTKSDNTTLWVMKYKICCGIKGMSNYRELNKMITFHGEVSLRQENITGKFDKSKDILSNWTHIQKEIKAGCLKNDKEALIIYLVQQTGIRIGNERDEKLQALTYGMQTLEGQHLKTIAPNKVEFDFLGKDSVPDQRVIEIDTDIWGILNALPKVKDKRIFGNNLNVNGYLRKIQPGATVKNLRTVVCNLTFIEELKKKTVTKNSTESEKIRTIFEANLEIAKTLNHQKGIGKNQKEVEQKIAERVKRAKDRVKSSKEKVKEQLEKLAVKEDKYRKLYAATPKLLKEKIAEIKEAKVKLETRLEKAKLAVEKTTFALDKKKLTASISLGTSLTNYCDQRVIYSYCKSVDLPIERIFTKTQLRGFKFAEGTDENFWRTYPN